VSNSLTFLESIRSSLHELMEEDPQAVVLGEDVLDPYGGAFKVTRGLSTRFPDRVFTTPISEASIVGLATGLALRGMHPVAEIMFGDFTTFAVDQLVNHASKYPLMYNGQVQMPLVVRTPMGGGRGYGPTHSQSLEKLFLGIPYLHVVAPSHFHNAGEVLRLAVADENPVLFIENKLLYALQLNLLEEAGGLSRTVRTDALGYPCVVLKNYPASKQPDVAILSYGGVSRLIGPLLMELSQEEIWVTACFPSCLSPLTSEQILESVKESRRAIVVEDGPLGFGWAAEVSTRIYDAMHDSLLAPVQRVGAAQTIIPASETLEEKVIVSKEKILTAVMEVLRW
jgi:pyruvate/2-oxoglutarate/acetoin dehydrogenase E1 component